MSNIGETVKMIENKILRSRVSPGDGPSMKSEIKMRSGLSLRSGIISPSNMEEDKITCFTQVQYIQGSETLLKSSYTQ